MWIIYSTVIGHLVMT
uniref:Uncharacterized protein n=1 Tax=Lepeophtheirus salmonis TaxID=72036 RepID=A0A0K2UI91_LEPSM